MKKILINIFFSLLLLSIGNYSHADSASYLESLPQEDKTVVKLIQNVNSSVVNITGKKFFEKREVKCFVIMNGFCIKDSSDNNSIVQTGYADAVKGSGFFITKNGFIITNNHVVSDNTLQYEVSTLDGKTYPAKVLYSSSTPDLALLKIEGTNFIPLKIGNSNDVMIGQTVFAIGNTLGQYQNTVTKGIITGLNRKLLATSGDDGSNAQEVIDNAIQTDASISLGNSGGPLIDSLGNLIGINTAIDVAGQNLGFAIPSIEILNFLRDFADSLRS